MFKFSVITTGVDPGVIHKCSYTIKVLLKFIITNQDKKQRSISLTKFKIMQFNGFSKFTIKKYSV